MTQSRILTNLYIGGTTPFPTAPPLYLQAGKRYLFQLQHQQFQQFQQFQLFQLGQHSTPGQLEHLTSLTSPSARSGQPVPLRLSQLEHLTFLTSPLARCGQPVPLRHSHPGRRPTPPALCQIAPLAAEADSRTPQLVVRGLPTRGI